MLECEAAVGAAPRAQLVGGIGDILGGERRRLGQIVECLPDDGCQ
jgi:hypothetical protein